MSTSGEYKEIIQAINKLSVEVRDVTNYLTRLDERIIALDNKVDNRISAVDIHVKALEARVQSLVDKSQKIELDLNKVSMSNKNLKDDFEEEKKTKSNWVNRYFIPLLLAGTIAIISSITTITFKSG